MAGKPQNRHELRRQYDAAEPLDPMEDEAEDPSEDLDDEEEAVKKPKKKAKAAAKKPKAVKVAKPAARQRIVWAVVNDAYKPVATFEYSQREAAETKAAEMTARGKGTHFVQKVKEAMPENAPGIGAALPRPIVVEPLVIPTKVAKATDEEEIDVENDEDDDEVDEDGDEEEAEADDDE